MGSRIGQERIDLMTVEEIEKELRKAGIDETVFAEWSDPEAARIGKLITEWSQR